MLIVLLLPLNAPPLIVKLDPELTVKAPPLELYVPLEIAKAALVMVRVEP